jgi:flavin-dependent dehydrogenase
MSAFDATYDAVVVGAGPAGTMTALELARRDLSVLLVERQTMPRWKVCGACLSAGTLEVLDRAGLPAPRDGVPLRHLRLTAGSSEARVPLKGSMAVSRRSFDQALLDAAQEEGVAVMTPARARLGPIERDHRVVRIERAEGDLEVAARVVIDAGGLGGGLASSLEVQGDRLDPSSRIGVGAVFAPDSPGYEPGEIHMAMGEGSYVGLVRVVDGTLTVAAALDPSLLRLHGSPGDAVGAVLRRAGVPALPVTVSLGWKGTPALTRTPATRGAERLFAVGDAAGYVEPFTGEGIAWALAGARALAPLAAQAAQHWDPAQLAAWDRAHSTSMASAQRLCRAVAWTSRRPWLVLSALRLLAHLPGVAGPFVRRAGRAPIMTAPGP